MLVNSRYIRWGGARRIRSGKSLLAAGFAVLPLVVAVLTLTAATSPPRNNLASYHIPAFARKYRTSCSTCHTAAPKLNVLGEAFRLNGYRFPENDALLRKDDPVPLGTEEWRDLWPRAIPPGEVPDAVPLAVRIINDLQFTNAPANESSLNFRFPEEVYLLGGATLGQNFGTFLELEWKRDLGVELLQAKVAVQDVLPWLPPRSWNLWVGLQNLYLFTYADRQIDRAGKLKFLWQEFRVSSLQLSDPVPGTTIESTNGFSLGMTQPAVEMNGLLGGRFYYGLGVSQGAGGGTTDNNARKDVYYKLRYKFGGLGLDGRYGDNVPARVGWGGQLFDRTVIVEQFAYFGAEPVDGGLQDNHRSLGINVRTIVDRLDAGLGYVWSRNDNPWGSTVAGEVTTWSAFSKVEYLLYPWLIGSLKFDILESDLPPSATSGGQNGDVTLSRILPGLVMLLRQNIRGVIEAEVFTEYAPRATVTEPTPNALWIRLDLAF